MTEADLQTRFSRWLRYNVKFPIAYELKITHTKRLPFSRLLEHQKLALKKAKYDTLCYKIPDAGLGQKPFDGFCITQVPAVVGVMFYTRCAKKVYLIDIDKFIELSEDGASLTEESAKNNAWRIVEV